MPDPNTPRTAPAALGAGALVWAAGAAAMVLLDPHLDLANLALLLVLTAALAALWWPLMLTLAVTALAVLGFNWAFVPPRGSLSVNRPQDALLLAAMFAVSALVATLMRRLRREAARARQLAAQAEALQAWGERLRDAPEPQAHAGELQAALAALAGGPVALLWLPPGARPTQRDDDGVRWLGAPDDEQRAGLWHAMRQAHALGPGTGRHDEQPAWYLPMRARGSACGAAVLEGPAVQRRDPLARAQAQALCDALGQALQRAHDEQAEQQVRDHAQAQSVRNALLAAISHDYRTPLATIVGAAGSLESQADKLDAEQRRRLARRIADEAGQLARLADNTLQLARLDAPGVQLRCDWESAEELVGTVLRHARQREGGERVRARLEPGLPLLWGDALLMTQLLDNLVDNALKYSPPDTPVELLVRHLPLGDQASSVVLAVRDRGPGVAPAWRERIFEVFHRGAAPMREAADERTPLPAARRGAGVGLAVCRAIAHAHGGELRLRARSHGGTAFEFVLPVRKPPAEVPEAADAPQASPRAEP